MIKTTATRHTAQTAFRAIEERLARPWLGPATPPTSDSESDVGDDVEVAVQRSIDELGFMLRAPITVLATVPFVFGLPIWPWIVHSRAYHLGMDVIYNRYKDEIVDPWIRSLKEEGEKSLIGTIEISSKVAKDLVTSALEREDNRYKREMERQRECVLFPYILSWFDLIPTDTLRQDSAAATTPQKGTMIKRMRSFRPCWIHGIG